MLALTGDAGLGKNVKITYYLAGLIFIAVCL
jgi:hypothetical protein